MLGNLLRGSVQGRRASAVLQCGAEAPVLRNGWSRALLSSAVRTSSDKSHIPGEAGSAAAATEACQSPTTATAAAAAAADPAATASATPQQLRHLQSGWAAVPSIAKTLGLAGLIPFIALSPPVAAHLPFLPGYVLANAAALQVGYGATIASFLGGVHWGAAMLDFRPEARNYELERYLWGVTPCLMAWPAIVMHPGPGAFAVATTLCVAHAVDGVFHRRGLMPPWYMSLRLPLSALAVAGLLITAGGEVMSERHDLEARAEAQGLRAAS